MPSHRAILAVVAAAVALGVAALAVVVLVRDDDAIQANGDLIAFSCKEPKNTWYAICIANSDGTDRRRITKQMRRPIPRGHLTDSRSRSLATRRWVST